ncbi:hypothetical protein BS50DRAFT_629700 [Corynespora cassiicola Philippines]|uniref:Small ribosomal subunit protein mS35 mitochondrial conserved domain-containing protein n=1 Tax=Corynespora cassiicola Philippines TaxID=1448308 RepID=A0A2T2P7T2_CORCC|nr:hypothetical protein BS50DRAFT_629700 [Corynespora cassiicola Philippines]
MASIPRKLILYSRRSASRIPARGPTTQAAAQWQRPLSSTAPNLKNTETKEGSPTAKDTQDPSKILKQVKSEKKPKDKTAAQLRRLIDDLKALDPEVMRDAKRKGKHGIPFLEGVQIGRDQDFIIPEEAPSKDGFWAEGEESLGADEDYYGDDLTSLGHAELEQHRELRHYARLIAWELPLLNQLARPFTPPTAQTPFRFRYTSYLGESHPATNKVVVEFAVQDMPNLTQLQRDKLIKLAGPRYNPDTDIIKMSCEQYDTLDQNKRFLGDTISALLTEARDAKDDFADVPFDFRHHKPKVRHEFPKEWILTPERKKYLDNKRAEAARLEDEKINNGQLLDGQKIIETSLPFTAPPAPEPVMVGGPRGRALR